MFMRRRGCGLGCGSVLLICVVLGLFAWFVGMPRLMNQMESGVADALSTVIANEFSGTHSKEELQAGTTVSIPFSRLNADLESQNTNKDQKVSVLGRENLIVMRWEVNAQSFELGFVPSVSSDGRLVLTPSKDGSWLENKASDVLSGGFEKSVNRWLQANGLILTDVNVTPDGLDLDVQGN